MLVSGLKCTPTKSQREWSLSNDHITHAMRCLAMTYESIWTLPMSFLEFCDCACLTPSCYSRSFPLHTYTPILIVIRFHLDNIIHLFILSCVFYASHVISRTPWYPASQIPSRYLSCCLARFRTGSSFTRQALYVHFSPCLSSPPSLLSSMHNLSSLSTFPLSLLHLDTHCTKMPLSPG